MAIQKIGGSIIELISQAAGDVAYYNSEVGTWVSLPKGEAGEVLTMNEEEDAPRWGAAPPTWLPLGTLRGYSCGGNNGSWYTSTRYNNIDSYSFVSDGNATDWGDLIRDNYYMASTSSATHGYICGGRNQAGSTLFIFVEVNIMLGVGQISRLPMTIIYKNFRWRQMQMLLM